MEKRKPNPKRVTILEEFLWAGVYWQIVELWRQPSRQSAFGGVLLALEILIKESDDSYWIVLRPNKGWNCLNQQEF